MRARVAVTLKAGILDPQGKAIEGALRGLGVEGVVSVRQGKIFDVVLETSDPVQAESSLTEACERLLANTVVENFRIEIEDGAAPATTPVRASDPTAAAAEAAEMPMEGHP